MRLPRAVFDATTPGGSGNSGDPQSSVLDGIPTSPTALVTQSLGALTQWQSDIATATDEQTRLLYQQYQTATRLEQLTVPPESVTGQYATLLDQFTRLADAFSSPQYAPDGILVLRRDPWREPSQDELAVQCRAIGISPPLTPQEFRDFVRPIIEDVDRRSQVVRLAATSNIQTARIANVVQQATTAATTTNQLSVPAAIGIGAIGLLVGLGAVLTSGFGLPFLAPLAAAGITTIAGAGAIGAVVGFGGVQAISAWQRFDGTTQASTLVSGALRTSGFRDENGNAVWDDSNLGDLNPGAVRALYAGIRNQALESLIQQSEDLTSGETLDSAGVRWLRARNFEPLLRQQVSEGSKTKQEYVTQVAQRMATDAAQAYSGANLDVQFMQYLSRLPESQAQQVFLNKIRAATGKTTLDTLDLERLNAIRAYGTILDVRDPKLSWDDLYKTMIGDPSAEPPITPNTDDAFRTIQATQNQGARGIMNLIRSFFDSILFGITDGMNAPAASITTTTPPETDPNTDPNSSAVQTARDARMNGIFSTASIAVAPDTNWSDPAEVTNVLQTLTPAQWTALLANPEFRTIIGEPQAVTIETAVTTYNTNIQTLQTAFAADSSATMTFDSATGTITLNGASVIFSGLTSDQQTQIGAQVATFNTSQDQSVREQALAAAQTILAANDTIVTDEPAVAAAIVAAPAR